MSEYFLNINYDFDAYRMCVDYDKDPYELEEVLHGINLHRVPERLLSKVLYWIDNDELNERVDDFVSRYNTFL